MSDFRSTKSMVKSLIELSKLIGVDKPKAFTITDRDPEDLTCVVELDLSEITLTHQQVFENLRNNFDTSDDLSLIHILTLPTIYSV